MATINISLKDFYVKYCSKCNKIFTDPKDICDHGAIFKKTYNLVQFINVLLNRVEAN